MSQPSHSSVCGSDDCGCGTGTRVQTPVASANRPGLSAVAFRAGTQPQFKASLLAGLSRQSRPALARLRTRDDRDFTVALLDAFAVMADVLTFYSERMANEAYLRTATERHSVLELARALGYELKPGVSASAWLAFTVENAPGAPGQAAIPKGTKVQSVPGPGEKPLVYETSVDFRARATWNELRPRLRDQPPTETQMLSNQTLYLAGTTTNLRVGDVLVISDGTNPKAVRVTSVDPDRQRDHTKVTWSTQTGDNPASARAAPSRRAREGPASTGRDMTMAESSIDRYFSGDARSYADVRTYGRAHEWDMNKVAAYRSQPPLPIVSSGAKGVFVLRTRLGFFGHNAPRWGGLPPAETQHSDPYANEDWDTNPRNIGQDSHEDPYTTANAFLERAVPEIQAKSWVVLEYQGVLTPFIVNETIEESLADYAMSSKCTGLRLAVLGSGSFDLVGFPTRGTTAHVVSEPLAYLGAPDETDLDSRLTTLELDRVDFDLQPGQIVALTGQHKDPPGGLESEMLVISDIRHSDVTTLTLHDALTRTYQRSTVRLNANVVPATHGETTQEVLGSGDATQAHQQFTLKQKPLTYAFARGGTAPESSLEVWVDDVKWEEVPTLFGRGPDERVYIARRQDDGTTLIEFGDGRRAARLPTGQENVRAVYRKGVGLEGLVKNPGQLKLLLTQPLGVKAVSNPLAATGAEDPLSLADARRQVPRCALTLDRVVSLRDYEDFARGFPGVAKALAVWTWSGDTRGVFLTLLGPDGSPIAEAGPPAGPLREAFAAQSNPLVPVRIVSGDISLLRLAGTVRVAADRLPSQVETALRETLLAALSFDVREFGQAVYRSELIALIQNVAGVVSVDLDSMGKVTADDETVVPLSPDEDFLAARKPSSGVTADRAQPAELLILDESSLTELKVIPV